MSSQDPITQPPSYQPPSHNTTLIESLREQPSFLMEQYNQNLKAQNQSKGIKRAAGVYIPPHKLRQLQKEMLEADPESDAHQKMMWQLLRKSINGIVNKVNIANIQNVVFQLFNQNIYRGRGLLARSIIKAQMASPNFTHVYTALLAIINTKVPQIGLLISKRVLIQFKRSFERNNKIVCVATTRMIAHLVNQRILGEYVALQILCILLATPTDDSVEIACDFMIEVGQVLSEITAAGATAIFQRFKGLLHQAQIQQKAQYSIQNLFAVRKTNFKEHPGVIPQLDLVEETDQITHQLDLEEDISGEQNLNLFKRDPKYLETEEQWEKIKLQILGQQNIEKLKQPEHYQEQWDEQPAQEGIQDLTEQDLINLRKTIYLAIQSTVNFEQCAHKILKMNIAKGYQHELVDMILECSMMERIYQSFFGLLGQRFCTVDDKFKELFIQAFLNHYNNIFKQEANKIRNLAHLFSHLFHRKALDWKAFQAIRLTPDSTTAAARMFLKIFFKDIAENMGVDNLVKQFQKEDMREYYQGLFPIDNPTDLRFAINYYTTIGLGKLTEEMREVLALQEEVINERKKQEEQAMAQLLMQEEEEMMRLALEEQQVKEQAKKLKNEQRYGKEKDKYRQEQKNKQQERDKKRERSRERHKEKRRDDSDRSKERQKGKRDSDRSRDRSKERQRGKKQRVRRSQKERERSRQKVYHRDRSKSSQREERGRDRDRDRERVREDERDRKREIQTEGKLREKEKQRQLQRRQRSQQREIQRQLQKQRQRKIQRQKQLQKEQRLNRQRQEQMREIQQRQKQQLKRKREKQEYERQRKLKEAQKSKKRRERSRSQERRQRYPQRKKKDPAPKRRARSSSSQTPVKNQPPKEKPSSKIDPSKKKKKKPEQEESSSGISSSSDSSDSSSQSSSSPVVQKVAPKKAISVSSDSSDSSSSSSNSEQATPKRKRVGSQSS